MTQTLEAMLQAELENPQYIVNDALLKNMVENLPVEIHETASSFEQTLDETPPMAIPPYLIDDPELVGYPDEDFQNLIYRNVAKYLLNCSSVKDFGCGRGDFSLMVPRMKYIGIDKSPVMQKIAAVKYPDMDFRCMDWSGTIETTDASVMIGSLMSEGEEQWNDLLNVIERMNRTTLKVCVLVLSDEVYPIIETTVFLPDAVCRKPFTLDASFANGIYAFVWWNEGFK